MSTITGPGITRSIFTLCFTVERWSGDLIRLTSGEQITYQTPLGVKMYQVTDTRIVSVNDLSPLTGSVENQLTLVTCVANRPDVRLIVTVKQAL